MERLNQHSVESNVQPLGANVAERIQNGAEGDPLLLELREARSPLGEFINALPEEQVKIFAYEIFGQKGLMLDPDINQEREAEELNTIKMKIMEYVTIPDKQQRTNALKQDIVNAMQSY